MKVALIIASFFFLTVASAFRESLTFDEIVHMEEGKNHLLRQTFAIDTNNPPLVRELAAIPLVFDLPPISARLVIVLLAATLLFFVYKTGGAWAAFILAFEPTFLAHSHYVTLDVGTALFFFVAYLVFLEFLKNPSLRNAVFFGIAAGLSFACRIQTIPYLLISILFFVRKLHLKLLFFAFLISILAVWLTYFFRSDVIIAARNDPNRLSAKILQGNNQLLKDLILIASYQPVPLGNYLASIKNSVVRSMQQADHRWYELFVNFLLKTPIPLLILIAIGLLPKLKRFFFIPAAVVFVFSSVSPQQPWIRYLLPAYPFLAITAAEGIRQLKNNFLKIVLIFWYVAGTLIQFPHFISYANELAGPRDRRFEKLYDSNLDWGQSLPDLADYLKKANPKSVSFSYFGRDNADNYGLVSNKPWGSYKLEEICAFHEIPYGGPNRRTVAISATNWHQCGFSAQPQFSKDKIKKVVADTILIF